MPYDKIEPAQWWHGAEPTQGPEPEALDADALRAFLAPAKPGTCRVVRTPDGFELHSAGGGGGLIVGGEPFAVSAPPDAPAAITGDLRVPGALTPRSDAACEVRAGDRVRMLHGPAALPDAEITDVSCAAPCTVAIRQPCSPHSDAITHFYAVRPDEIGPPGSGKPWTLLPPVPVLDAPVLSWAAVGDAPDTAVGVWNGFTVAWVTGCVWAVAREGGAYENGFAGTYEAAREAAEAAWRKGGWRNGRCADPTSDALPASGGGGRGGIGPRAIVAGRAGALEWGPALRATTFEEALFDARSDAAAAMMPVAQSHGWGDDDVAAKMLRAADAVPDPRRGAREAAIRRLLDAARDIPLPDGMFPDLRPHDELREAADALEALDGEGGG